MKSAISLRIILCSLISVGGLEAMNTPQKTENVVPSNYSTVIDGVWGVVCTVDPSLTGEKSKGWVHDEPTRIPSRKDLKMLTPADTPNPAVIPLQKLKRSSSISSDDEQKDINSISSQLTAFLDTSEEDGLCSYFITKKGIEDVPVQSALKDKISQKSFTLRCARGSEQLGNKQFVDVPVKLSKNMKMHVQGQLSDSAVDVILETQVAETALERLKTVYECIKMFSSSSSTDSDTDGEGVLEIIEKSVLEIEETPSASSSGSNDEEIPLVNENVIIDLSIITEEEVELNNNNNNNNIGNAVEPSMVNDESKNSELEVILGNALNELNSAEDFKNGKEEEIEEVSAGASDISNQHTKSTQVAKKAILNVSIKDRLQSYILNIDNVESHDFPLDCVKQITNKVFTLECAMGGETASLEVTASAAVQKLRQSALNDEPCVIKIGFKDGKLCSVDVEQDKIDKPVVDDKKQQSYVEIIKSFAANHYIAVSVVGLAAVLAALHHYLGIFDTIIGTVQYATLNTPGVVIK